MSQIIHDGERAQAILDDPLVVRALDALDAACVAQFREPAASDEDIKQAYYLMQMALKFRHCFIKYINDAIFEHNQAKIKSREVT